MVDLDGDIFKQREGMKHPRHRILKLSVVSSQADSSFSLPTGNSITEGFLVATTLYSVNWFRIETRNTCNGKLRPLLIPLAKQGFLSCVVDACWSPHFWEESAVLLETGELCWFNLVSKRGGTHKISLGDGVDPVRWLGCKFGGQPWVILVASSISVVLIDLRPKRISEAPKVLARVNLPDFLGVVPIEAEKDTFQAFCRASFNDFHFSVVTGNLLVLFDIREPLVPVLTWDHGLEDPTYVSMFRLSELRPYEEFKWSSESGFMILVGSFWRNEFRLFCYGPSDKGAFGSSFLAWELPSSLSLSGKRWSSTDDLVREIILKEKHPNEEILLRNEGVAGFFIVPSDSLLKCRPGPGGFVLIRLMFSGKLELQEYHSSCGSHYESSLCQGVDLHKAEDFTIYHIHEGSKVSTQFYFFKLCYLSKYLNRSLSNALIERYLELNDEGIKHKSFNDDLSELLSSKFQPSGVSISSLIADVSIPTNLFDVASRRILNTLQPELLSLAFTRYEELFVGHARTSSLPLEFPNRLPQHRFPPFFVNIPLRRSEFLLSKVLPGDAIVGPILPLPVLLVLQQKGLDCMKFSDEQELDGDLLTLECMDVLQNLLPETAIANSYDLSGVGVSQELQDDKQFFVYQPKLRSCRSMFDEDAQSQADHLPGIYLTTDDPPNDVKFKTFICGNFEKNCHLDFGSDGINSEFLDVSPVKLDFEPLGIKLQQVEQNFFKSLKNQASKWLENNKSYQEFCSSSKISKPIP